MLKEFNGKKDDEHKEALKLYFDADGDVSSLVAEHMEIAEFIVLPNESQDKIFIYPGEFNKHAKKYRSSLRLKLGVHSEILDYYLANMIILILLSEFYSRDDSYTSKSRDFLTVEKFKSLISKSLKNASENEDKEDLEFDFDKLYRRFDGLLDNEKSTSDTKDGFVRKVLEFLEKEGLIKRSDQRIEVTDRLTTYMDSELLNINKYSYLKNIFKGGK